MRENVTQMRSDKQELAYSTIRSRILSGEYAPGRHLVTGELAGELEMSPLPVRLAIHRLTAEGLVESQPNRSARVAGFNAGEWERMSETLAVLEGYAAAITAPLLQPDDLDELRSLNKGLDPAQGARDPITVSNLAREFHKRLYQDCPNQHLHQQIQALQERLEMSHPAMYAFLADTNFSFAEHEQLIELIEQARPPSVIEAYMRAHRLHGVELVKRNPAVRK